MMKYWSLVAGTAALFMCAQATASVITFEDAGSKGLSDNDLVTTEWKGSDGVTFVGARLEQVDGTDTDPQGFLNDQTGNWDDAAPGYKHANPNSNSSGKYGLGNWFLRTDGNVLDNVGNNVVMTISYDHKVYGASGQIWDIDGSTGGTEKWLVEAFLNGSPVTSDPSPIGNSKGPGSLDGKPWEFSLSAAGGFDEIKITFKGSKTSGLGLAFDNFNSTGASLIPVPGPSSIWLMGFGAVLLGFGTYRMKRNASNLG